MDIQQGATDFRQGLVTDTTSVAGSLAHAVDAYVDDSGWLKQRGAKTLDHDLPFAWDAATVHSLEYQPEFNWTGVNGMIASITDTNGDHHIIARSYEDADWTDLGGILYSPGIDENMDITAIRRFFPGEGEMLGLTFDRSMLLRWGGSTKNVYSTGTCTTVAGSKTVTGHGTNWMDELEAGMYIKFNGTTDVGTRHFRIVKVVSDTEIEVDAPLGFTHPLSGGAGILYRAQALARIILQGGTNRAAIDLKAIGRAYCVHNGNTFIGSPIVGGRFSNHMVAWTAATGDPMNGQHTGVDQNEPNAKQIVCPSVGGFINGLLSVNGRMLILKKRAICVQTGIVSSDGRGNGQWQILSDKIGNLGFDSYDLCEQGAVWADIRGAYISDGYDIKNIVHGRITRRWKELAMGGSQVIRVSAVGGRVIFDNNNGILIYNLRDKSWLEQRSGRWSRVCDVEGKELSMVRTGPGAGVGAIVDWASDYAVNRAAVAADYGHSNQPLMDIVTQPIPTGNSPFDQGLPTNLILSLSSAQAGNQLVASVLQGIESIGTSSTNNRPVAVLDLEAAQRLVTKEIRGASEVTHARVRLSAVNAGANNAAITVYGIGIQSSSSSAMGKS